MGLSSNNKLKGLRSRLCKSATMFLFYILPRKVSRIFVEVSIYILFSNLRSKDIHPNIDIEKLNKLLNRNYNKEFVDLPNFALSWFWSEEYLNKPISLHTGTVTLKEAFKDNDIMKRNLGTLAKELIDQLPDSIKYKLNLKSRSNKLTLKHNLMCLFVSELKLN